MNIQQHLNDRRYPFPAWIDQEEGVATFPLWNLSGQMVGYQQYRPGASKTRKNNPKDGKYFTYIKEKRVGVWGLESWDLSNALYITEGVFDACAIIDCGFSAIAVLSCDVADSTKRWLATVRRMRPVFVIADGDAGGRKLLKLGHKSYIMPEGKDMGDMTHDEAMKILKEFE